MEITTKRCILRPFIENDIDAFMRYRNNEEWMKYQSFKGLSKKDYQAALLKETNFFEGKQLAILLKTDGQLIGDLYLRQEFDFCWLGYSIHPKFARKGYIQEVVIEVSNFLKQAGYKRIKAGILIENTASKQLVKKLGFVYTDNEADEEIYVLEL